MSSDLAEIFSTTSAIQSAHDCCVLVIHQHLVSDGFYLCGVGEDVQDKKADKTHSVCLAVSEYVNTSQPLTSANDHHSAAVPSNGHQLFHFLICMKNTAALKAIIQERIINPISKESAQVKTKGVASSSHSGLPGPARPKAPSDLHSPRATPYMPYSEPHADIGHGDLYPGSGGGGMLYDPLHSRRQGQRGYAPGSGGFLPGGFVPGGLPPGAVPPGARFDPVGPPGINPFGPGPRAGHLPDNSLMKPPGFGDFY